MSCPGANQLRAGRQDSSGYDAGTEIENRVKTSEITNESAGNEEAIFGSYGVMSLAYDRDNGQKHRISKSGKGEWEVAGDEHASPQFEEDGAQFAYHSEMKGPRTSGTILGEQFTDTIGSSGQTVFLPSTAFSNQNSVPLYTDDQEPLLRVDGKYSAENEDVQSNLKKHAPISNFMLDPGTQHCQKNISVPTESFSVNLLSKAGFHESSGCPQDNGVQRDVANLKADMARLWRTLMAVVSVVVFLTFAVMLLGCWILIVPKGCLDLEMPTTEGVKGPRLSHENLFPASSRNPPKTADPPGSNAVLSTKSSVGFNSLRDKHFEDLMMSSTPSQLLWKRMSEGQPRLLEEDNLEGSVSRSSLGDEQEVNRDMAPVSFDLKQNGRPLREILQSAKNVKEIPFGNAELLSIYDNVDNDEDDDDDDDDDDEVYDDDYGAEADYYGNEGRSDDTGYKIDENEDIAKVAGSDDGEAIDDNNDDSNVDGNFHEAGNAETTKTGLQTSASHNNEGQENPYDRSNYMEIEEDAPFSLESRNKRSAKKDGKRGKGACDCDKNKKNIKRLRRCCLRGKSSKMKADLYEGQFFKLFDMERDLLQGEVHDAWVPEDEVRENCMQVKDWPGKPAVCRDTYLKIQNSQTPLGCFQPKKKAQLTQFNNGTGVFKVKKSGLYFVQARLTLDDDSYKHWAAVVVDDNAELACPPGGFKRALNRTDTHKLRTCQMSGLLQLKKSDKMTLKIMSEGVEIALEEEHMPTFSIVRLG